MLLPWNVISPAVFVSLGLPKSFKVKEVRVSGISGVLLLNLPKKKKMKTGAERKGDMRGFGPTPCGSS